MILRPRVLTYEFVMKDGRQQLPLMLRGSTGEKKVILRLSLFNPFTTGNPFLGTKSLGFSIGRDLGALKGLRKALKGIRSGISTCRENNQLELQVVWGRIAVLNSTILDTSRDDTRTLPRKKDYLELPWYRCRIIK